MMLIIKHIVKKFSKNTVLKSINLDVNNQDRVVIIGPSGSGKSTLLRCINKLEKPTSGEILFNDKLIDDNNINDIRKHIGMVFQSFNLFNNLTILENIIVSPVENKLMTKNEAIKKAKKLLDRIGLLDKIDAYPSNLSGGQQQRVAIIRSLMMNPEIMLFDEPTSALDPEMIDEVLNLMMDIADDGMTMVIVTHELSFAKKIATKVVFIADGKVLETGSPDEIFNHPKNERLKEFLSKVDYK